MKKILLSVLFVFSASLVHAGFVDFKIQNVPDPNMRVIEAVYISTVPGDGTNISISTEPSYIHSVIVSSRAANIATNASFQIWNSFKTARVLGTEKVIHLDVNSDSTVIGGIYDIYLSSGIVVDNDDNARVTITYRLR